MILLLFFADKVHYASNLNTFVLIEASSGFKKGNDLFLRDITVLIMESASQHLGCDDILVEERLEGSLDRAF